MAATAGSINFAVDSFSQRGNISDTIGGKAATAASINTRVGSSYSTFVKPLVALRPRQFDRKSRNLYTPSVFNAEACRNSAKMLNTGKTTCRMIGLPYAEESMLIF